MAIEGWAEARARQLRMDEPAEVIEALIRLSKKPAKKRGRPEIPDDDSLRRMALESVRSPKRLSNAHLARIVTLDAQGTTRDQAIERRRKKYGPKRDQLEEEARRCLARQEQVAASRRETRPRRSSASHAVRSYRSPAAYRVDEVSAARVPKSIAVLDRYNRSTRTPSAAKVSRHPAFDVPKSPAACSTKDWYSSACRVPKSDLLRSSEGMDCLRNPLSAFFTD
jgi:hypothetical protein